MNKEQRPHYEIGEKVYFYDEDLSVHAGHVFGVQISYSDDNVFDYQVKISDNPRIVRNIEHKYITTSLQELKEITFAELIKGFDKLDAELTKGFEKLEEKE